MMLAKSLFDDVLEAVRDEWGNTNVAVIKHWRDAVLGALTEPDEPDSRCHKPCAPEQACDECASYWRRMRIEGYWDEQQHRWTDKGWREMTK